MAKLNGVYPWKWSEDLDKVPVPRVNWKQAWREEGAALDALCAKTAALPEGQIVGAVLRWPRADGFAFYIVTNDKPLTLQHLPCGDRWQVENALIRGLTKKDVLAMVRQAKALAAMFIPPIELGA
jgi:hypothetical protein